MINFRNFWAQRLWKKIPEKWSKMIWDYQKYFIRDFRLLSKFLWVKQPFQMEWTIKKLDEIIQDCLLDMETIPENPDDIEALDAILFGDDDPSNSLI